MHVAGRRRGTNRYDFIFCGGGWQLTVLNVRGKGWRPERRQRRFCGLLQRYLVRDPRVDTRFSKKQREPPTFSSSIAFLALVLSSRAMWLTWSSSRANFRFHPTRTRALDGSSCTFGVDFGADLLRLLAEDRPACVSSKSRMARSLSSLSSMARACSASCFASRRALSARFISFF